jgi:hypothetical protein
VSCSSAVLPPWTTSRLTASRVSRATCHRQLYRSEQTFGGVGKPTATVAEQPRPRDASPTRVISSGQTRPQRGHRAVPRKCDEPRQRLARRSLRRRHSWTNSKWGHLDRLDFRRAKRSQLANTFNLTASLAFAVKNPNRPAHIQSSLARCRRAVVSARKLRI